MPNNLNRNTANANISNTKTTVKTIDGNASATTSKLTA